MMMTVNTFHCQFLSHTRISLCQTSCIKCTQTLYTQIKLLGGHVLPEEIANMSMEHGGTCYQNSNLQPASAEEQQSVKVAKSMLINSIGDYIGNNVVGCANEM